MWSKKKISEDPVEIAVHGSDILFSRDKNGVATFQAENQHGLNKAFGYLHAHDRFQQMELTRLLGQGRLCEQLKDTQEHLRIDIFMRHYGFARLAKAELAELDSETREYLWDYTKGVNHYLETCGHPASFHLLRHKPEPWQIEDSLLMVKLISFLGLAQTQQDAEKWIVSSLKDGVDPKALSSLFAPDFSLDEAHDILPYLSELTIPKTWQLLSSTLKSSDFVPSFQGSNNWVMAPEKSRSNSPLMACDPHLDVNRLPPLWHEVIAHTKEDFFCGVSMPGIPGVIMGRTSKLSYSFTYGFMDMVDYFVEDIQNGMALRENERHPVKEIPQKIVRAKSPDYHFTVYQTDIGPLETTLPQTSQDLDSLSDGYYLSRALADTGKAADTIKALFDLHEQKEAQSAAKTLSRVGMSANWLIADTRGNISLQQSGSFPRRAGSGLLPLKAWQTDKHWRGLHETDKLVSQHNPAEGHLVSANQRQNLATGPTSVNLPMADYRFERIHTLLSHLDGATLEDFKRIQYDLYSLQAKKFLDRLRPLIQKSGTVEILNKWDLRYDKNSRAAGLFENFYRRLIFHVFSPHWGKDVLTEILGSTSLHADYYGHFDRILLANELSDEEIALWFPDGVERTYNKVLSETLESTSPKQLQRWGLLNQLPMKHILWGETWLGRRFFNRGPFAFEGSRATVAQANLFQSHGMAKSFGPSWRFLTDLGKSESYSNLPGSSYDGNGKLLDRALKDWLSGHYKTLNIWP